MTEPRMTLASPDGNPAEVQSLLDTLRRPGRPPLNLFLALARHPELLRDYLPVGSRLLLRATGELVGEHTVGQATWDTLSQAYDDAALVELTMLVGHYAMLAGLLNAAQVPRDEGAAGFPRR